MQDLEIEIYYVTLFTLYITTSIAYALQNIVVKFGHYNRKNK